MAWFFARFVGLLLLAALIYNLPIVEDRFIEPWNHLLAQAAFGVMHWADSTVQLSGNVLSSTTQAHAVSVESDCNGIEPTLLVLSAVLAFPASWSRRIQGLAVGLAVVQGLNLVRIVSLFYFGLWDTEIFDWTHKYLWPVVLTIAALATFVWWLRSLPGDAGPDPRPQP
jgi:exosortase H (IPTLxxWG-CTERM-specific)